MRTNGSTIKLEDTSAYVGAGSRLEAYWTENGFKKFFQKFRKGSGNAPDFVTVENLEKILKRYHLHSVGFGNWLSQEDRYNYVSAMLVAFYDLEKVLGFKNNLGLDGKISLTFGARGKSAALAHFEPHTFIINLTRYVDNSKMDGSKYQRFLYSGGAGSLAHEYGHALDYYFALFHEQSFGLGALTGGRSVAQKLNVKQGTIGSAMASLMDHIIWAGFEQHSDFYKRLQAATTKEYFFRRNEIFARWFESYVFFKLEKAGISNAFLTDTKYDPRIYPVRKELEAATPLFENLILAMRKKISNRIK